MGRSGNDRVTLAQRAALDEDCRDGAAALVQVRLNGHALGGHVRVGAQVQFGVGRQHDGLEQLVQTGPRGGGDVDEHGVAAVLLRHQAVLGQLATDLGRVRAFLVDLVDRHHDGQLGRLGVVEGLDGLRHDAVIGGHHEHGDVRGLGATGTHGREGLVTGGVDEGDLAILLVDGGLDLVGTDGLGDASGLAALHIRASQRVEQLGLAVVDVTHDRDGRRTGREVLVVAVVLAELEVEAGQQLTILVLRGDDLDLVVELGAQHLEGVVGHRLGGRDHLTEVEQHLHQLCRLDLDLLGQVREGCTTAQAHDLAVTLPDAHTANRRCLHLVELLPALLLALATSAAGLATASEGALGTGAATATAATAATTGGRTTGATTHSGTATAAATGATTAGATTGATATSGRTDGCILLLGHHRRVGTGHAGQATATTGARHAAVATCRGTGARTTGTCTRGSTGTRRTATLSLGAGATGAHALRGGEGVVAGARATGATLAGSGTAGSPRRQATRGTRTGCAGTRCLLAGACGGRTRGLAGRTLFSRTGSRRTRARSRRRVAGDGTRGGRRRRGTRLLTGPRGTGTGTGGRRRSRSGLVGRGRLLAGRPHDCGLRGLRGSLRRGRGLRRGGCSRGGRLGCRAGHLARLGGAGTRGGRLRGSSLSARGGLAGAGLIAEVVTQATHDGRLNGGRRGPDEFAHVLQRLEDIFAFESELFRELVDTDLCHYSPSGPGLFAATGPVSWC